MSASAVSAASCAIRRSFGISSAAKPGFAAELMLKDLRLSQLAATEADADTPMGQLAMQLYERFVEDEDGLGRDFSAMLPRFEARERS